MVSIQLLDLQRAVDLLDLQRAVDLLDLQRAVSHAQLYCIGGEIVQKAVV
jgi:hypothetical protein